MLGPAPAAVGTPGVEGTGLGLAGAGLAVLGAGLGAAGAGPGVPVTGAGAGGVCAMGASDPPPPQATRLEQTKTMAPMALGRKWRFNGDPLVF
jgi:hypothetical protein